MIKMTEGEKSTITIRGIDRKIYNKLSGLAKELDKTVGELLNEAMSLVITLRGRIEGIGSTILLIDGVEKLEISGKELSELDRKVLIQNVNTLTLKEDVDTQHIKDKIYKMMNIQRIIVKSDVNKLVLYSKCVNVKEIVFESNNREDGESSK